LQLLKGYFTGPCNYYWSISLGLAIATELFHWALQPLQGYFTEACNYYWIILLGLATATGLFHWGLQLLLEYFTGHCILAPNTGRVLQYSL
jgi:hypothetical protein